MELILRKDMPGLGDRGAIVKVKTGYARNYLIPKGIAYQATGDAAARIAAEGRKAAAEEEAARKRLEELVRTMESIEVEFEVKHEGGKLFGSVTAAMVAEALTLKLGVEVAARQVELEHPIKEIGPHDVEVHVFGESRVRCKVWVLEERPR